LGLQVVPQMVVKMIISHTQMWDIQLTHILLRSNALQQQRMEHVVKEKPKVAQFIAGNIRSNN